MIKMKIELKNKKLLKIAAFITAVLLIIGLCVLANMFVGNPVSRILASKAAEEYLEKNFPDTPYFVDKVDYSFKDGSYYARILLPGSRDNNFNIGFSPLGERQYCDYETLVKNRQNTAYRLIDEYSSSAEPILRTIVEDGYVNCNLVFDDGSRDTNGLRTSDLELDGVYDVMELGRQIGCVTAYILTDDITPQTAAKYLLDIKKAMDDAGAGFSKVDLTLRWSDGTVLDTTQTLYLFDFPYSEIYEDNLAKRIQDAIDKAKENQ